MAKLYGLCVGIITALLLCQSCLAEVNATGSANGTGTHCPHHGNRDNCTDSTDTDPWSGHLSECPQELEHYCIHGECRYVKQQNEPSCKCHYGYTGHRCEYVILGGLTGNKREVIVICAIAGLLLFILFIVFLCCCVRRKWRWCWQRKRRREAPSNGTEKLSMMGAGAPLTATAPGSGETPHTDAV